jgi:hypothetical protein
MPTDACQYFYECEVCKALLKPNAGDCCVFCSFGSVMCPSKANVPAAPRETSSTASASMNKVLDRNLRER